MLTNWQRLENIIRWAGLSVNSFALTIGLKRSENLYQIKKGNNGISKELVDLITNKYPNISKGWLFTGEGEMFIDSPIQNLKTSIPYYGLDAIFAVTLNPATLPEPFYYINLPPFDDCTLAALSTQTAMHPDIPAGSTVILKQWDPQNIVPGETYLVISDVFKGIRKVRLSENHDKFTLVPSNIEEYDPIMIPKEGITDLYMVRGIIINKII